MSFVFVVTIIVLKLVAQQMQNSISGWIEHQFLAALIYVLSTPVLNDTSRSGSSTRRDGP